MTAVGTLLLNSESLYSAARRAGALCRAISNAKDARNMGG